MKGKKILTGKSTDEKEEKYSSKKAKKDKEVQEGSNLKQDK